MTKLKTEKYKGYKVSFTKYSPNEILAVLHITGEDIDITESGKTKEQAFNNLKKKIKGYSVNTRKRYKL